MRVDYSPFALADLQAIREYIARDKPLTARAWTEKLVDAAEKVGAHPLAGRVVPEVGDPKIREVLFKNYRILYRIEPRRLLVLMFAERHRRLRVGELR